MMKAWKHSVLMGPLLVGFVPITPIFPQFPFNFPFSFPFDSPLLGYYPYITPLKGPRVSISFSIFFFI